MILVTTKTLIEFPMSLYCFSRDIESGKAKEDGNPKSANNSFGVNRRNLLEYSVDMSEHRSMGISAQAGRSGGYINKKLPVAL